MRKLNSAIAVFRFGSFYCLSMCVTVAALATDYYVSPGGSNSNPGTSPELAWQTIDKVNQTDLEPGDCVMFEGGQTFVPSWAISLNAADAGTPTAPVIVTSYGEGRATIQTESAGGNGIYVGNAGGVEIRNINFHSTLSTSQAGIRFENNLAGDVKLEHVRIENVEVSGYHMAGVFLHGGTGASGYRDVEIRNVIAHGNLYAGIRTEGTSVHPNYSFEDVTVADCIAYDNSGAPDEGTISGSGIVLGQVDRGIIERCEAYHNCWLNNVSTGGPIGIWFHHSRDSIIQYCSSHDNLPNTYNHDGGGYSLDYATYNCIAQYNLSYNNSGPGYLMWSQPVCDGNVIRYNLSINDGINRDYGGIYIGGGGVRNVDVYHNTIFSRESGHTAVRICAPTTNVRLRNNIIQSRTQHYLANVDSGASGIIFQGNLYWRNGAGFSLLWRGTPYTSLSGWRASGQEMLGTAETGFWADPLFLAAGTTNPANYGFEDASPAFEAGLDLSQWGIDLGGRDYLGSPVPLGNGPDIGAIERLIPTASSRWQWFKQ